jgi:hypothetical protein
VHRFDREPARVPAHDDTVGMTTISAPLRAAPPTASLLDIEALLGFRPSASIALYLRRRRRPPAALRVDLPPAESTDVHEVARVVTGLVARVTGAVSAELVLYGRDSDDRMSMPGHAPLLAAIRSRLVSAGFEVPRASFVVDDHWGDADAVLATVAATGGASPGLAAPSAVPDDPGAPETWHRLPSTVAVLGGALKAPPERPADPHHGPFVPIAPASEQRRARAMAALGVLTQSLPPTRESERSKDGGGDNGRGEVPDEVPGAVASGTQVGDGAAGGGVPRVAGPGADRGAEGDGGGGENGRGEVPDEVGVVETLLRWNDTLSSRRGSLRPSDARSVALLWSLQHRVVRDCVLMLCAWGFDAGVIAFHEATEPDAATIGAASVHDTFVGVGDRAPAPAALRSAIDLLRHLVSCAPQSLAAPALTMLAWLEWARGRGLVADAYLEAGLRADPGYQLARLLQVMIRNGFVPEWIGADSASTLCRPR